MDYAKRIKVLRIIKGFTQEDMAAKINMPKSTYIKKENQQTNFYIQEAIELARVLDVDLETIFFNN